MKCPNCAREMRQLRQDLTYGKKQEVYDRIFYRCEHDDWWVTVEIPQVTE